MLRLLGTPGLGHNQSIFTDLCNPNLEVASDNLPGPVIEDVTLNRSVDLRKIYFY